MIKNFIEQFLSDDTITDKKRAEILGSISITPEILSRFINILRKDKKINLKDAIDISGTGGSRLPRLNTSTITSFVLAALEIPIAKHGNKAASGGLGALICWNR